MSKICKVCSITKETSEFYNRQTICKSCYKARQKKRYYEKKDEYVKYVSQSTQTDNNYDDIVDRLDKIEYLISQLEISLSRFRD